MQPLAEQPLQVLARDLLGHFPKRLLVHVLELPAGVIGAQDTAHRFVAHDVPQLLVEQLRLGVHHLVVGEEVAESLARQGDGLAPASEVEHQYVRLERRVGRAAATSLEEPARLEAREPLVEKGLAPFVVGEDSHGVVVADFMDDEAQPGRAVHHHHRELGAAPFDAVHVGERGPGKLPVQRVEPREGCLRVAHGDPPAPRRAVLRQVEHTHHHVAVAPFVVHVARVEREGEMMDLLGVEMDALACGRHGAAPRPPVPRPVPAALIIDPQPRIGLGVLPPRVAFDDHAGGPDDLVLGQVEQHVVRRELAVELARGIERVVLPSPPVVHHDLGIPLREIEASSLAPLAPREGRGPRPPIALHHP